MGHVSHLWLAHVAVTCVSCLTRPSACTYAALSSGPASFHPHTQRVLHALRWQRVLTARTLEAFDEVDVLVFATTHGAAPVQPTMRAEANFSKPTLTASKPYWSTCRARAAIFRAERDTVACRFS